MAFFEVDNFNPTRIHVVGVGGGGGNALNTMISKKLEGVQFIAANTDLQALDSNRSDIKIQLGKHGLGAGANPGIGRQSAEESVEDITKQLSNADLVFIVAGMGGGTGTGAAAVTARIAREQGALTIGVVTKPFNFEGRKRMRNAIAGIEALEEFVDTLVVIPNERIISTVGDTAIPMVECFNTVDDVLVGAVQGISDIMVKPGLINVDFADVRTVMTDTGRALMGTGTAKGNNRTETAIKRAIESPLLENVSIQGATGLLVNITADKNISIQEINSAMSFIESQIDIDAESIFGTVVDSSLEDTVRVTVIATGFQKDNHQTMEPPQTPNMSYDSSVPRVPVQCQGSGPTQRPASTGQMMGNHTTGENASAKHRRRKNNSTNPMQTTMSLSETESENHFDVPAFIRRPSLHGE